MVAGDRSFSLLTVGRRLTVVPNSGERKNTPHPVLFFFFLMDGETIGFGFTCEFDMK